MLRNLLEFQETKAITDFNDKNVDISKLDKIVNESNNTYQNNQNQF